MRLGLIARADNSGLGIQSHEFYRHMHPDKVLVIDVGHLHNGTDHTNKRTDLTRYPGATRCEGWIPSPQMMLEFINGLDVVFSCETFYRHDVPDMARGMGVKTVLQPNFEFLDHNLTPDLWAVPSLWNYDFIPEPKIHLPVPIATDRFTDFRLEGSRFRHFLHIVGRPAVFDRNGTSDLLQALHHVTTEITVTMKCQTPGYINDLIAQHGTPPANVTLIVDSTDVENYWDNYRDQDVLIMPRRFGGLCLPVNEALGAGMAVIMPDIAPNNTWLPNEWLAPATHAGAFRAKQHVDYYQTDVVALAAKIEQFDDYAFQTRAARQARNLAQKLSWDALKPIYEKTLEAIG